jgi:hypothetical protein
MGRAIRFLCVLPLLFVFGNAAPPQVFPEAHEISNWPAPPYWRPQTSRALGRTRTEAVSAASAPLPFIAQTPCRQYDSRDTTPLPQATPRSITITGAPCGIPASAAAVSLNITVFDILGATGNAVFQVGTASPPTTAWLNYPASETQRGNAGVLPLSGSGEIFVEVLQGGGSLDFTVDVNGYYDGSGTFQLSLSRRAALDQFWTPQNETVLGLTTVGAVPALLKSDGADIWVANNSSNSVSRVRASDGRLLETWTGATGAFGVLVAMGRILVTGSTSPGQLYMIDPSQTAAAVTTVASNLGNNSQGIAFDGARVWTANLSSPGSVSILTPGAGPPWVVTTVTNGFSAPRGALYDGVNVWVTDLGAGTLLKLDSAGTILQTVIVGSLPQSPVFDGTNIWVPNRGSSSVTVVQASSGAVLKTLTGNGLNGPEAAAFDGERVTITNFNDGGNSVSLWKAADLAPLGSFATGSSTNPFGACSDGINFWITLAGTGKLARF